MEISQARSDQLQQHAINVPEFDGSLRGGRLICTDFETDNCEVTELESNGFFDSYDIPGWDSWWHCATVLWEGRQGGTQGDALICYVPPVMLDAVEIAMANSSSGEIDWLEIQEGRYLARGVRRGAGPFQWKQLSDRIT